MIPYGRHCLDDDDIEAVIQVLRFGDLTQGDRSRQFEEALARYVDAKFAVAVSSGTAALHLACLAADLGPGNRVLTSANTFISSANCALYVGAEPGFIDIDSATLNISLEDLESQIGTKEPPSAVIPVHFAGLPCDMNRLRSILEPSRTTVIEDASHALGAMYADGSHVGNCRYSDMTIFSFHPVKAIAAGEGGAITTNSPDLYERLMTLRSNGIVKDRTSMLQLSWALDGDVANPWYYEMQRLGYNYRLTDFQCALATSQLRKIDIFVARRRALAKQYDDLLARLPGARPTQLGSRDQSAHHLYVLQIDFEGLRITRRELMERLAASGVATQVHYIPVPLQPYYRELGHDPTAYPQSMRYYRDALTIPLFYGLSDEQQLFVVDALRRSLL